MKRILLIDMHNTLVDEVKEYGPAIDAAIDVFIRAARKRHLIGVEFDVQKFKDETLYPEIRAFHRQSGDDWDNRAFDKDHALSLYALLGNDDALYEETRLAAIHAREQFSHDYITQHVYPGAIEFIHKAKQDDHTVYIVTDANQACAEATLSALGLDGVVDGVFCPRSSQLAAPTAPKLHHTPIINFAPEQYKPDATIVADILVQHAKDEGWLDNSIKRDDLFTVHSDESLPADAPASLKNKLILKESPHMEAMQNLLDNTIGIGDDYRDHLLFHNAGITSIAADYGKVDERDDEVRRGKNTLKAVTGWSEERLNLLQAVGGKNWAAQAKKPNFHCRESLMEALRLLPQEHAAATATMLS